MRPSLNRSLLNKRALSDGIGASFEDVITGSEPGQNDIYCQFKYRQVTPNDFGLTTEEIFRADEKDLNKWMSIKRICAYRYESLLVCLSLTAATFLCPFTPMRVYCL
ncbi:unnamed protein product [Protopolystoma xenopodis]|uniref:Protein KRI1 homolog n=1 Tax=Protopolystoma xenopodis TaxID=117903 RepID=A0A448WXY8_9PLAT|nr:unnamed protein product [Protopolystoma xenopodis]